MAREASAFAAPELLVQAGPSQPLLKSNSTGEALEEVASQAAGSRISELEQCVTWTLTSNNNVYNPIYMRVKQARQLLAKHGCAIVTTKLQASSRKCMP